MLVLSGLLLFLSFPASLALPSECSSPTVKDKAVGCINQLSPMLDKMKSLLNRNTGWLDATASDEMSSLCTVSLDCFKYLQKCASISSDLILNMDGVCDEYRFITGDFKDCTQKLGAASPAACVTNFFLNPAYTDSPDNKTRCRSFRNDGKCVKALATSKCSKDEAKDFQAHLDDQMKRFSC